MAMFSLLLASVLFALGDAAMKSSESGSSMTISNDRLTASVNKAHGAIDKLTLDGQDLLGGGSAKGPYLDCYCVPEGFYAPGSKGAKYSLLKGSDWAGIVMSEKYPSTGQILEQYWFLRDKETGLHTFSRLAYPGSGHLRNLQEFRTLFRPTTKLWTHLSTNDNNFAPLPRHNPATGDIGNAQQVQDATWYLPDSSDPYVQQYSSYFTKYTFADTWGDHQLHGLFADGSTSPDGSTFGAWFVMSTIDTYFGGPTHSDLTVDGIVYNYMVSNHRGNHVPEIEGGFDRTFGPGYYYFNRGGKGSSLESSREDAMRYLDASQFAAFYDSIAQHVPGYKPSSARGSWQGNVQLPASAKNPTATLSQSGFDYQDNVDAKMFQYIATPDNSGKFSMTDVVAGTYRLTIYADEIFGQYIQDEIQIAAGKTTTTSAIWKEESAGTELWRIGTPDKSAGEYRHGHERDQTHPLHPEEYRIFWGAYDFNKDFPNGVSYTVGKSDVGKDMNYVHWAQFHAKGKRNRAGPRAAGNKVSDWTISFDVDATAKGKTKATFTVQLAGASTGAGNTGKGGNLSYTVAVNGKSLEPWTIPASQSSSCATRSGIICYNVAHKFEFDAAQLVAGSNKIVLSLPPDQSVYVQYDALRLEVQ